MKTKITIIIIVLVTALIFNTANAQNTFPSTGRAGIYTTSPVTSLQVKGGARIGTTANYVNIDSATGKLTFAGTGVYQVAGNKYAFQYTGNPNYGLYFNSSSVQYEFRNGSAIPVFSVSANTGNSIFNGTLKVGAYTLPATDGANGQVLKTNGSGALTWSTDNGTNYTAGTGINITANAIINTAPDKTVALTAGTGISVSGTYPNFTIANTATGSGSAWLLTGNAGTNPANNFLGTTDAQPLVFRVNNARAGYIDFDSLKANTSFGSQSLGVNTSGYNNTAIGYRSLFSNTQGDRNTAIGTLALYRNTTGYYNTGIGYQALYNNVNSIGNTATGLFALFSTTFSIDNTADGIQALYHTTTGVNNTGSGGGALLSNTTGNSNSGFGFQTLFSNITGSDNTALGNSADVSADGFTYATALGDLAIANASYKVVVGPNISGMVVGGYAPWSNLSDGRFKENVKENVPGLIFINKLRPVTYTINTKKLDEHIFQNMPDSIKSKRMQKAADYARAATKIQTGLIAQEVEKIAKDLDYNFDGINAPQNPTDNYSLAYSQFIMPLIKAVQELSASNDAKDAKIDTLQNQLNNLRTLVLSIQQKQNQCSACSAVANQPVSQSNVVITDASSLQQNIPNPFTNTTSIGYTLSQKFTSAQIVITDKNGNTLKAVNISGSGKGNLNVDASTLASGAYQYSLMIDGRLIATKQMVIAK